MRKQTTCLVALGFIFSVNTFAQTVELKQDKLEPVGVSMSLVTQEPKNSVRVEKSPGIKEVDEPTFVKLKDMTFKDGIIEISVLSKLRPDAPEFSRGFIGVAFRINDDNSKFECIYIRPTNGRADDQVRRNHSIQYFAYPDYKFTRLRKEAPEKYETYADMGLNEWIKMKIVVKEAQARLFLNDGKQPSLIVNDLKHGADASGAIGLWVDVGTEGYFSDLKVYR